MYIDICSGLMLGIGMYLIAADIFHLSDYKTIRNIKRAAKNNKDEQKPFELMMDGVAEWLSGYIRMNEFKRAKLAEDMETTDMNITPERFVAENIIKSGIVMLFAIPFFFIFPVVGVILLFSGFALYMKNSKSISEKIKIRRRKIESELPRLEANIEKNLKHSRNVLGMLESYKEVAGPELREELFITTADMRSGNYEIALSRLESRVGSAFMSDIVRGLISVIHGEDTDAYFAILQVKFSDFQRTLLKEKASGIPGKVKRLSFILLAAFILIYVFVIVMSLINSVGSIIG